MSRLAFCLTIVVFSACVRQEPPPPLPKDPWVAVLDARGERIGGLAPMTEPYHEGKGPRIGGNLDVDARDRQGRTINGWGLNGWVDANRVQLVFLNEVVLSSAPGRRAGDRPILRWEVAARYSLVAGETKTIEEAKALGLGVMSVRLEGRNP